jgi:hypothetical protein
MGDIHNYRRTRGPGIGAEARPPSDCVICPPLDLREYWLAPELLHTTNSNHLRRLLGRALTRLATLEGWAAARASRRTAS